MKFLLAVCKKLASSTSVHSTNILPPSGPPPLTLPEARARLVNVINKAVVKRVLAAGEIYSRRIDGK
jgi:hypothetical protein